MPDLFTQNDPPPPLPSRFAQVVPERGLEMAEGLTYGVPEAMADLRIGDRVIVPLGRGDRPVSGYVIDITDRTTLDAAKIKLIASRDRRSVNLPDDLVELARWISHYYCCPLGMVLVTLLPAAVKHGTGLTRRTLVDIKEHIAAEALPSVVKHHRLPQRQTEVLGKAMELALVGKMPIDMRELAAAAGAKTAGPVRQLIDKGFLKRVTKTEVRAMWGERRVEQTAGLVLTHAQQKAVDGIVGALGGSFSATLLHGVTGSGKTEVYIRAVEAVVKQGHSAIVLVPEISLTPQTVARFMGRFAHVAVLHSGLTDAQRHEQWLLIRDGFAKVVVGARSAVFAPAQEVGLIIVDEEADGSYKQDQAPRYHARDVAIRRAQMLGVPVVLGSATPSLETWHNATVRRTYRLIELPDRVPGRKPPHVVVVDMSEERRIRYRNTGKAGVHLLSLRLEQALRRCFDADAQAMLLLNRRGYANYIACPDHKCGWMMTCDYCSVRMVYHLDKRVRTGGLLRCHYCSFENRLPEHCPVCGKNTTVFGLGTQRIEEEIGRKFPDIPVLRMDSDAMRTAQHYEQSLERFRKGDVRLLVGTQMIAKGLDFPNVRLVGVISADTALNLPDFRAAERTYQLVSQVAGRSGRGEQPGMVVVQTFTPDHPAIVHAAGHDYTGFATAELEHRATAQLPPITRMARIVIRDRDLDACTELARTTGEGLRRHNEQQDAHATILGPRPPSVARIGGWWRQEIVLTAANAVALQKLLGAARKANILRSDLHMAVDVDPVSLL
jgi:primosomal protein N' (replication factor Y)